MNFIKMQKKNKNYYPYYHNTNNGNNFHLDIKSYLQSNLNNLYIIIFPIKQ